MKKLLIALVFGLLTLIPCYAQQGVKSQKFTIAGPSSAINLVNTSIAWHQLTWSVTGTASACMVALDTSSDGKTWSAGGAISAQDCTSNGSSSVVNVTANYVRINMNTLTISSGGSVTVTWDGWISNPGGGGSIGGSIAAGQIAFGDVTANTIAGSYNLTWNVASDQLAIVNDPGLGAFSALSVLPVGDPLGSGTDWSSILTQPILTPSAPNPNEVFAVYGQTQIQGTNSQSIGNGVFGSVQVGTGDGTGLGVAGTIVGVEAGMGIGLDANVTVESDGFRVLVPIYTSGATLPPITNGIEIQNQVPTGGHSTTTRAIHIDAQTSPGKAIVVDSGGGESDFQNVSMSECISGCILVSSLTTTAATSDNVSVTGMTSSGHCSLTPTNATAIGLATLPYISAKTTDQITVTHAVTASATFDILCTPY